MNPYDSRYMLLQEEKLKSIQTKQATVIQIAKELNVSRQTLHKWISRYKRFGINDFISQKRIRHNPAHNRTGSEVETTSHFTPQPYIVFSNETISAIPLPLVRQGCAKRNNFSLIKYRDKNFK